MQITKVAGKSKYKYVLKILKSNGMYAYQISVHGICRVFKTEREAALKVDMILIEKGKEPVNILKRKK